MDVKNAADLHSALERLQRGIRELGVRRAKLAPVLSEALFEEFCQRHLQFLDETNGIDDAEKLKTRHWTHEVPSSQRSAALSVLEWLDHQQNEVCGIISDASGRLVSLEGRGPLDASAHAITSCFGVYRIQQAAEPGRLVPSWLPYATSATLQDLFLPPSRETATQLRGEGGRLFRTAFSAKNASLSAHATLIDAGLLPVAFALAFALRSFAVACIDYY